MKKYTHPTRRCGFSLLELSVVLGIIALIAGAGISMAQGALKAADRITTQERLNTIKLALDSYAKTYGYLPCPFDRALTTSNSNFGVEARTGTTCTAVAGSLVNNGNTWFGGVPVRTLGLPDNYAGDAWGNKLAYAVSANHMNSPTNYSSSAASITMRYGDLTTNYPLTQQRKTITGGTGSDNGSGNLRVTFASTDSLTTSMTAYISSTDYKGSHTPSAVTSTTADFADVPFIAGKPDTGAMTVEWQQPGTNTVYAVISHGPDGRGAFPFNGTAIPGNKLCNSSATANSSPPPCTSNATMSCIDIMNCNNNAVLYDTAYNDGSQASQYFDDYIVWGSNDLFRAAVANTLYFNGTSGCASGNPCELWCAKCKVNYPGGSSSVPPSAITANAILVKKIMNSDSTQCSASCIWSGTTALGYEKIP